MARSLVEHDVAMETRDGVTLIGDLYRPAGEGSYPTLVHRTPYDKRMAGGFVMYLMDAVKQGYAILVQDCRGRFKSDGEWIPFAVEAEDGYDTVEWVAEQPWCNGQVGIYGSSYMGVTTLRTLIENPPHLEAAFAYSTGSNYHEGWTYSGGAFELGFNFWWALFLGWDTIDRLDRPEEEKQRMMARMNEAAETPLETIHHTPLTESPALQDGAAPYWHDWLEHPSYDSFWKELDINQKLGRESIAPCMHMSGWHDMFLRGHLDFYQSLKQHAPEEVHENQRFVLGPWHHFAYTSIAPSRIGDREMGPQATTGPEVLGEYCLNWFDHWLKDESTGIEESPRVRYFVMGENRWKNSADWPPDHTPTNYYLHSQGSANSRYGDGTLSRQYPESQPSDSYTYDPADPVPTEGGRVLHPTIQTGGVQDQSEVEEREDVLVYTSSRLTTHRTIAGPVEVTLYASSSAPDTDFTAKLVDVEPDGYCMNLAEGILRVRYRNSIEREEFIEPGEIYQLSLDLWATAHTFQPGHRIRLEIASSNFPRFDRNMNRTEVPAETALSDAQVAHQEVLHDSEHPSHISLPVV